MVVLQNLVIPNTFNNKGARVTAGVSQVGELHSNTGGRPQMRPTEMGTTKSLQAVNEDCEKVVQVWWCSKTW